MPVITSLIIKWDLKKILLIYFKIRLLKTIMLDK